VNKQWRTTDKGWRSSLGVGRGVTTPQRKKYHITNHSQRPRTRTDTLVRTQQWKRDFSFGTWSVSSLHRLGSLVTVSRELARYKIDLVGAEQVRRDTVGAVRVCDFFLWKRNENYQSGTGFFVCHRIASAVNTAEFVSDMMSYIALRGRWCNITVMNVNTTSEEKSDDLTDSFDEELEQVSFIIFLSTV